MTPTTAAAFTGVRRFETGLASSHFTRSVVPRGRHSTSTAACASSLTTTTRVSTRCPGARRTRRTDPCTLSGRPSSPASGTARRCPVDETAFTRTLMTATGSTDAFGTSRTRSTAFTSLTAPRRSSTMKRQVPATTPNTVNPSVSRTNVKIIAGARATLLLAYRAGRRLELV